MKEQLHEAWRTNNKIDLLFIELIDETDMNKTLSARGGRTVCEQLVHMHNVRMQWLDIAAKEVAKNSDVVPARFFIDDHRSWHSILCSFQPVRRRLFWAGI